VAFLLVESHRIWLAVLQVGVIVGVVICRKVMYVAADGDVFQDFARRASEE
jgi:hypothetical protein